ncbi:MAG: phosphoesterase, partial [Actinomycetota bacterium]|nr:phosphoesterase [Actinomycetota bacterium]
GFTPTERPTMHLLGYFIPDGENGLSAALRDLQFHRANRNQLMVQKLNELGVPTTFEEVEMEAGGPGSQIGRPHFAAVLVRHGVVPNYQAAFDEYLAKGAKAYLTRKLYKPVEAIELMTAAGVVPVLAHPFTLNLAIDDLEVFVDALVEAGLQGIEGYHGDLPEIEQEPYRALGEAKGLIVSGGSDYHGDMRPDRGLPGGKCHVSVPDGVLGQLRVASEKLKAAA